jgi:hypothetical protein
MSILAHFAAQQKRSFRTDGALFLKGNCAGLEATMFDWTAWDAGWWLWVVIDIAAVVVFAAAILYGSRMWKNRPRDPAIQHESDEATRRMYHREDDRSPRSYR